MTIGAGGRLEGKSAFVTGAGSGIGRATAELFGREGAQVGVADVNIVAASVTAETIRAAGGNAEVYQLDVANPAQVKRAIAAFAAATGSIHVLVNNAGVVVGGAAGDLSDADWSRNLEVNLGGAFHCCREALAIMVRQASGAIVSVSSTSALHPVGERAGYIGCILATGEEETLHQRHAMCFVEFGGPYLQELVLPTGIVIPIELEKLDQIQRELDNLRAALRWWIQLQDAERALKQAVILFHLTPVAVGRGTRSSGQDTRLLQLLSTSGRPAARRRQRARP